MTKNIAASVRARLTNKAKADSRPFQELLQYYGLERFLYRISQTEHRERFILKGALMLASGQHQSLGRLVTSTCCAMQTTRSKTEGLVRTLCNVDVEDEGLVFDASTVAGERIKEDADYEGVRVKFTGFLEKARIPMQLDIGFGDVVHPSAQEEDYPTILEFPGPRLRMYPRETVVAEKFQAMVYLGTLNSRMKDFFDIWLLARHFNFDGVELGGAIAKTFDNRGTPIETEPVALTHVFTSAEHTAKQWAAFLRRTQLAHAPKSFDKLCGPLRAFLLPVAATAAAGAVFAATWSAPGPWRLHNVSKTGQDSRGTKGSRADKEPR